MTVVADRPPLPRRSLYQQFVRQLLVPLLLAFALATTGTVLIGYHAEQSKGATERRKTVDTFAQSLVKPLWDCDNATAQGIVDALAHLPAVAAARLTERCQEQRLASGTQMLESGDAPRYRTAIVYRDERSRQFDVGELEVQFHPTSIITAALEVLWRYLVLFFALLGVMLAGTLIVFRRTISEPLDRFRAAIRTGIEPDRSGTSPLEQEIRRHNDELGDVMQAYDELMLELTKVIGQLRENEQALMQTVRRDPLTGLGNRLVLEEELERALRRAQRHRKPGCVLLIDLNGFKPINDTHAHAAGDRILQETARRLQAGVRHSDTVVRLGGDEFVVIVENLHGDNTLQALIDKLGEAIAQPQEYAGHILSVGASIGAARFPDDGTTSAALLVHADRAMYARKSRR